MVYHPPAIIRYTNFQELEQSIKALQIDYREALVEKILQSLPVENRVKILQKELRNSNLVVMMDGSNSLSSEISLQIQHAPYVDLSIILEAVVERRRANSK